MNLHFAYGSNMCADAMQARCPSAVALGTAELGDWRFLITRDGYASILPEPGAVVYGVVWRLAPRDWAALNTYEALDTGLYARRLIAVRRGAQLLKAVAYVGRGHSPGKPRPGYQEAVVAAARGWDLPAAYLAELEQWLPARSSGLRETEPGSVRAVGR